MKHKNGVFLKKAPNSHEPGSVNLTEEISAWDETFDPQ
jgi:hypothetical protein